MKIPSSSSTFLLVTAIIVIFVLPTTNAQNDLTTTYAQFFNNTMTATVELTCDESPPSPGKYTFEEKYGGLHWVFKIPAKDYKNIVRKCHATWNGKKADIVVYDASFKDQMKCRTARSPTHNCYWAASTDGIYFSPEGGNFPGPNWRFATPWSPK